MSTNARTSENGTARLAVRFELGVDDRGAHHCADYTTDTPTVHVVYPDGTRGRRYLDGGTVDDYMAAVEREHGWDDRKYGVGLVDLLTRGFDP